MTALSSFSATNKILPSGGFFVVFAAILLLFGIKGVALAHIEAGPMPDAVAEMEYNILLEFEPQNHEVRAKLGMVYLRMKKYSQAAQQFSLILEDQPDNSHALDAMGQLELAQEQPDAAAGFFRRAIAINPEDPLVHFHLGQALEAQTEMSEAEAAYLDALKKCRSARENSCQKKDSALIEQAVQEIRAKLTIKSLHTNEAAR